MEWFNKNLTTDRPNKKGIIFQNQTTENSLTAPEHVLNEIRDILAGENEIISVCL